LTALLECFFDHIPFDSFHLFHFVSFCFQPQAGHSADFVYKEPCLFPIRSR
jgi:hypothetical protein